MALLPGTTLLVPKCRMITLACNFTLSSGTMNVRKSAILPMLAPLKQWFLRPLISVMYFGMESPSRSTESWSSSGSDWSDGISDRPQSANSKSATSESSFRALRSFTVRLFFIVSLRGDVLLMYRRIPPQRTALTLLLTFTRLRGKPALTLADPCLGAFRGIVVGPSSPPVCAPAVPSPLASPLFVPAVLVYVALLQSAGVPPRTPTRSPGRLLVDCWALPGCHCPDRPHSAGLCCCTENHSRVPPLQPLMEGWSSPSCA